MLIRAERIFDGTRLRQGCALRIDQGRVTEMNALTVPGEEQLRCHLLSPGYVDIHIHGCLGHDTMKGEAHVRFMAQALPRFGVTAFVPTTMAASLEDTRAALEGVSRAMVGGEGAQVLGCHLEGPFLNPVRKGAQPAGFLLAPSLEAYRQITQGLESAVRMMTIAPELPDAGRLIEALREQIVLSAGHTDATCEQMAQAARLGVSQATHLFNGMNLIGHRAPGAPGGALTLRQMRVQLIADLLHLHPAALKLAWLCKGPSGCILITDAMEAAGMPDGDYTLGANRVCVRGGEARLVQGNLAGSTLTMDRAVRNMAGAAEAGLCRALRMATRNPCDALGLAPMGRIVPGAWADLVLLDEQLRVQRTLVRGRTCYQS